MLAKLDLVTVDYGGRSEECGSSSAALRYFSAGFIFQSFLAERRTEFVVRQRVGRHDANRGAELGDGSIEVAGSEQSAAGVGGERRRLQIVFCLLISAPALLSAAAPALSPSWRRTAASVV